ncbi:MAG: SpoIID/LytB domain-containing protein [Bacteroidales bacterium]
MIEPKINVGIMFQPAIRFNLDTLYTFEGNTYAGEYEAKIQDGKILFNGKCYDEILFESDEKDSSFVLHDVVIGIGFHWERKEDQRFRGNLRFIVEDDHLTAINILFVEEYLKSVISSEMSATSSKELLKAHAVISRSWLLYQTYKRTQIESSSQNYVSDTKSANEWIKWWDREDHLNFDVCADDHCQRYQGITRASQSLQMVEEAVEETRGELLMYDGVICDARFSKCCGGVVEEFQNCWEPVLYPYLTTLYDGDKNELSQIPDLTKEDEAEKWIRNAPAAYCNTKDKHILNQVLNNYDQETTDFYRWKVSYSFAETGSLIRRRLGLDLGEITNLIPRERGKSGRITKLEIQGTKDNLIIGKELLIRKALSESHLYSSAFVVDKSDSGFVLTGAGWGHGVGLCQIGAAVMAENGFQYRDILAHYFPDSELNQQY